MLSSLTMKTVILSGGQGYRLKEETEFKPKPMVRVGDHPILWHIMKIYEHHGFNDFVIALGYKGEMIKDYFLNHKYYAHDFTLNTKSGTTQTYWHTQRKRDNFKITFVDTGENTLTAGRVLRLKPYLHKDPRFMVTYGDGVGDIDIKAVVKYHQHMKRKHKVIATIVGVHPTSKWGLVEIDKRGLIKRFQEKPRLNQYVNGGFTVMEKSIFRHLKPDEQVESSLERLAPTGKLALYIHPGFWYAMDTYRDMQILNEMWESNPKWKVWQ